MAFDCMDDCIHLHACRRVQAIGKKHRLMVPRYCTEDCSCYQSKDEGDFITVSEAVEYARNGASSIRGGYDSYDVYAECDLQGQTIGEILEEYEEVRINEILKEA